MTRLSYGRTGWFILGLIAMVALVLSISASPAQAAGRDWYVATWGNDSNDGTSGSPLASIQTAINNAVPGDTVVITSGTYDVPTPIIAANKYGSSDAWLTIRGEGQPVLRGTNYEGIGVYFGLLNVENSNYVNVKGIKFENSSWYGLKVYGGNNVIVEDNVTTSTTSSGINVVYTTNATIRNNDLSDFCREKEPVRGIGCQEGLTLQGVNGFAVTNNHVHNARQGDGMRPGGGEGIDAKQGSSNGIIAFNYVHDLVQIGIYVDAYDVYSENIEVYGNRVHNTATGITIASEAGATLNNVKVHDNVIWDTGYHGIDVPNTAGNGLRQNLSIYNNTVVRSGRGWNKPPWCALYGCSDYGYGIRVATTNFSNLRIHDNIVYDNFSAGISQENGASGANIYTNIIFPQTSDANQSLGSNPIIANPLFVSDYDFHLQQGSPAIGTGAGGSPLNVDADGRTRPSWPIDIGAFMY